MLQTMWSVWLPDPRDQPGIPATATPFEVLCRHYYRRLWGGISAMKNHNFFFVRWYFCQSVSLVGSRDWEKGSGIAIPICRHAILLPRKKFSWNRTIGWWVTSKKAIFKMGPIFGHVTVIGFNIWCSVPNFIEIGPLFTEIWRFIDF